MERNTDPDAVYGGRIRFPGRALCGLFTSTRSVDNIRLYEKLGYVKFDEKAVAGDLIFVYMEKKPNV